MKKWVVPMYAKRDQVIKCDIRGRRCTVCSRRVIQICEHFTRRKSSQSTTVRTVQIDYCLLVYHITLNIQDFISTAAALLMSRFYNCCNIAVHLSKSTIDECLTTFTDLFF